jgi:hypothetical protein
MDDYDLEMDELGAELGYGEDDGPDIDFEEDEDDDDYRAPLDLNLEDDDRGDLPEGCHLSLTLDGEDL